MFPSKSINTKSPFYETKKEGDNTGVFKEHFSLSLFINFVSIHHLSKQNSPF